MSAEPTTIERVTVESFEDVVPMFVAYRAFYDRIEDAAPARAFLRERLERDESFVFLARVGTEPAGFTQVYKSFSSVRLGESLILNDLFVQDRFRRLGVARALCQRVIELAQQRGAIKVELATAINNIQAQQLYEQLGFVRNTTFYEYSLSISDR